MNIFKWLFNDIRFTLSNNSGAIECDGVNAGVWKETLLGSSLNDITVSCVITPFDVDLKSRTTWDQIITFNGSPSMFYLCISDTGYPVANFYRSGGVWVRITGVTQLTDNVPIVLTATYSKNARSSLYINGIEDSYITAPNYGLTGSTSWNFTIGGESYRSDDVIRSDTSFYGKIEEYYIWTTVLNSDEAKILASKIRGIGRSIKTPNLHCYFPLDDCPEGADCEGGSFYNKYTEISSSQVLTGTTGLISRASVLVSSKSNILFPTAGTGNVTVEPSALTISLSLNSPDIITQTSVTPTPNALGLTLSLQSPTIDTIQNATITPSTLTLSLSLQSPTISTVTNATPTSSALTLALTLNSPTIEAIQNSTQTPSALSLTLSLLDPVISATMFATATPSTLPLTLTLFEPTIIGTTSVTVFPSALTLALTLNALTINITDISAPVSLPLTLTLNSPTINIISTPASLELALSLLSPGVSLTLHNTVTPDFQQLTLSLNEPTVEVSVIPSTLALTLSLNQPSFVIYPHPVELTLTLLDPYIAYDYLYTGMDLLSLNLTLNEPRTDTGEFRKTKGPKRVPTEPIAKRILNESTNKIVNSAIY